MPYCRSGTLQGLRYVTRPARRLRQQKNSQCTFLEHCDYVKQRRAARAGGTRLSRLSDIGSLARDGRYRERNGSSLNYGQGFSIRQTCIDRGTVRGRDPPRQIRPCQMDQPRKGTSRFEQTSGRDDMSVHQQNSDKSSEGKSRRGEGPSQGGEGGGGEGGGGGEEEEGKGVDEGRACCSCKQER